MKPYGRLIAAAAAMLCLTRSATAAEPSNFAAARFSIARGAGGVPINVVEIGDPSKPAILLIHGYRQSYLSWTRQFNSSLATNCHLVAFDLRGHGNSGAPWEPSAYDNPKPWADDVAAVIKATGIQKPLIVAWSFGGNVAMDFARQYPQLPVKGYVLVGTAAGMRPLPLTSQPMQIGPGSSPDLETNFTGAKASTNFIFDGLADASLKTEFEDAYIRSSAFLDRSMAGRKVFNNDMAAKVTAPVTILYGEKDPVVPPPLITFLKTVFPKATVIPVPDAGHAPFIDNAAAFNDVLDKMQCKAG